MPPKPKFDPRKLMELAIKVMHHSMDESRTDGKVSPMVGAVLWRPDGSVDTSFRGELRYGDHAEYTLLERKNRNSRLDGCRLFSTLEPCAPGSRRHPKLSCAERIVLARIEEIWIGIEDPDPKVDRKGIKYLQDCGIRVFMFDRDLQERIGEANKAFFEQAHKRAEAVRKEKKPKIITLSQLENAFITTDTKDFSTEALEQYRTIAKINDSVDSPAFNRRLLHQGLLQEKDDRLIPTGFGLLLFGKEPRTILPQCGLLGTIYFSDGTEEPRDFDGPQVLAPEQVLGWLQNKLPHTIDRSEARRKPTNMVLFELVREGIVNALVHRNYNIKGAKCQLIVTPDTIKVKSPGLPVEPITLKQMQAFNAPMLSRNPMLHYIFARMELAEERGLGLKSMNDRAEKAGLPLPRYTWENPYLVLTIYISTAAAVSVLSDEIKEALSKAECAGWEWMATKQIVTSGEYASAMYIPSRTALNHLKNYTELGLVRRLGSGPTTRYEVVRQ